MKKVSPTAIKVLLALLLLAGVGRLLPETQNGLAKQFRTVDLAALGLTPEDLEKVGLTGYGSDYGVLQSAAEFAASIARRDGYSPAETLDSVEEMGLQRAYTLPLSRPIEGGGFEDVQTAGVWFTILEFETTANASFMFDMAYDEIAADGREVIDGTHQIGEDSVLSRADTLEVDSGDPMSDVMLEFFAGTYYVAVDVYDVARDGEFSAPAKPRTSVVESLGEILLDRIDSAELGPLPAMGTQILRMTAEDGSVVTVADRYSAIGGTPHRRYAETDDDLASRADTMERDRLIASYVVEQDVASGIETAPGDPHMIVRLYEFETEAAAAEWLDEAAFDRYSEEDYITDIEPMSLPFDLGDDAMGASYEGIYDGAELVGHVVWVQVDAMVARVSLDAAEQIDLAVVEELVETQVNCLGSGSCASIDLPNALS
jgi:hypothetical protein